MKLNHLPGIPGRLFSVKLKNGASIFSNKTDSKQTILRLNLMLKFNKEHEP